jgi:SOS regulatory protein LexA
MNRTRSRSKEIKILGEIRAGFPSPAEEDLTDSISLDQFLIQNPQASYLVKVAGDSMIEAGILPGDLVVVDRSRQAAPGDIVIAQVDGGWTMKYFHKENGKVVLKPANKKYKPIYPENEMTLGGVVVANVRKYR